MASLTDCSNKSPKTFSCGACNKIYNAYQSLKRHVKESHPNEINNLAPSLKNKKTYEFKCEHCSNQFNNIHNLRFHMRRVHNYVHATTGPLKKCAICRFQSSKEDVLNHLEQEHNFKLEEAILNFKDLGEFESWKKCVEKETKSKFVLERGTKKTKNSWKQNFKCHHSGFYIPTGKGLRRLKTQGSCKINGFCPAAIKMLKNADNSCSVRYYSNHICHQNDIGHLTINEKDHPCIAPRKASRKKKPKKLKHQQEEYELEMHFCVDNEAENTFNENNILVEKLSEINDKSQSTSPIQSLFDKRKSLKERFVAIVDSIEEEEDFKILEDNLKSMLLKIEANKSSRNYFSSFNNNSCRNNKKIEPHAIKIEMP